ncbi:RDD family protein [Mycobacteroides salmoniphilum]|uniref:RDD family protein n=1 Tax=Mycobacteroides salmoniphilum TaxID=404941 RepID=A0A4R8S4E5_9MYCO|nr:RDD family protein [Mycobacteroides salmoniphilum]TDZ79042.1 RDD family protein [Mycobacteroides salmoniphilum]
MTEVPPPFPQDPGGYPPPPPAAGAPALPGSNFEIWIKRVGAWIIDLIPYAVLVGIGQLIAGATMTSDTECVGEVYGDPMSGGGMTFSSCSAGYSGLGIAALVVFWLLGVGWLVWNWGLKQGTTGSSIGKGVLGIQVLGEATGQPIGFGMSVVRSLAHVLDAIICYIGFLLPLFTPKRQTIADMLVKTVVVPK